MNELLIASLIFLVSFILIYKDFNYSIYILIILSVLLHKELFSFYRWDLLPVRSFTLALLCVGITKLYFFIFEKKSLKELIPFLKDPVILTLALLWIVRGVSIVNSKNLQASLYLYGFFTCALSMFYQIYLNLKSNPEKVLKYIKFFIYVVFALTLFGYFQVFILQTTGVTIGALWYIPNNIPRVGASFWDVNHYGALISALLPILIVLIFVEKKPKQKILNSVMALSMFASLLLTSSRTAWIIFGVSFLVFVSILLIRKVGARGILYVFISLVLISIPVFREYSIKSSPFRAQVKQYFHYRLDSFDSHIMLLTGAYQIFEEYPVLGGGYGSFFEHFSKTDIASTYFGRDPAALNTRVPAHTIWGELIAETGILGLSTFILFAFVMIGVLLYNSLRSGDRDTFLISSAMTAAIIGWFTGGIFYSYNSEFFFLVLALYLTWGVGKLGKVKFSDITDYFLNKSEILLVFLVVISAFLLFWQLGNNHLIPWDEAIYAQIAKNMVKDNEYVVLRWYNHLGSVWYEKPPLYMWLMAFFMKFMGFNAWAARLPGAVFGLGTVIITYFLAKKLFNKTVGFISGLALITSVQFLYYARASMLDVTATFFLVLSLYLYFSALEKDKKLLWILSGVSIGLSVMTKGVVGLLPLPIIGVYEIYLLLTKQGKLDKRRVINYILMLSSVMVVALPWHIEMYKRFNGDFLNNYLGYHVWDRAVTAIEDKGKPFFWYLVVLKVSMRLWFVVLLAAFPFSIFKTLKSEKNYAFLVFWSLLIFLFFSVAKSKIVWYMTPIYPALAIIAGVFIEKVLDFVISKLRFVDKVSFKAISLYALVITVLFYFYLNKNLVYTSDLTGSQVEMLEKKDELLGTKSTVYIQSMEYPIILFYSQSPFEVIDFHPEKIDRIPVVLDSEPLILITKKGRYSDTVLTYDYPPQVLAEKGDWILWYFPPRDEMTRGLEH